MGAQVYHRTSGPNVREPPDLADVRTRWLLRSRNAYGRPLAQGLLVRRGIMRYHALTTIVSLGCLLGVVACAVPPRTDDASYPSVRARLENESVRLVVSGEHSTGAIIARRWLPGGWLDGTFAIAIDGGELSASIHEGFGELTISNLDLSIAPIEIPVEVFGRAALLTDVRLSLRAPAYGGSQWNDEGSVSSSTTLALDLHWALAIDRRETPLASQQLPPLELAITIGGTSDAVDASLALGGSGELWNWFGLLKLVHLELSLAATSVDAS
jgi:hypothetical protein